MKLLNFILLSLLASSLTFSQCEILDIDDSGAIQGNEMVMHLAHYGTDSPESDFNEDGIVNIDDIFILARYTGMPCPIDGWLPESSGHILGVVLQEYHYHDSLLSGAFGDIPAGSTTFRLYIELAGAQDDLIGVYGNSEFPLQLSTDTEFYLDYFTSLVPNTTSAINPSMMPIFPGLEYSTYLAVNSTPEDYNSNISIISDGSGDDLWMGGPTVLEMSSEIGGGWMKAFVDYPIEDSPLPNLQLIGQFTVESTGTFSGLINVQAKTTEDVVYDHYEIATGLTFSSDQISIFGCTDSSAPNYNPEAEYSDGSCTVQGDFDGDGVVSVDDLLTLIQYYGCLDCPDYDMNGDGVIGVFDILDFLLIY